MKKSLIFTALFFIFVAAATAQFSATPGWWVPSSTWDFNSTIYRAGSLSIQGNSGDNIPTGQGYQFYIGQIAEGSEGGYGYFGLTLANSNINYTVSPAAGDWNRRSLILSGWAGLGFKTHHGSMMMHENGVISMGLQKWREEAKIRELSVKTADWVQASQGYTLYVRNGIVSDKIKVATIENWPDYVFKKGYPLLTLSQVDTFIQAKGHLPNTPSAEVIESQGLELGATTKNHQEKIEELFLYLIEMEKRIKALETENARLKTELHHLKQ